MKQAEFWSGEARSPNKAICRKSIACLNLRSENSTSRLEPNRRRLGTGAGRGRDETNCHDMEFHPSP